MAHDTEHDCSHLKEALGEYLDGEFDSELCRELREHMEHCERCRVVVDTTRRTIHIYGDSQKRVEVPPGLLERLQQKLKTNLPPG